MASAAAALLSIGLIFYLSFRPALPVALQRLHVSPFPFAGSIPPSLLSGSFPSFVHVAAFALLTCAFLRANFFSALAAGVSWAAIDILWEVACDHPAVHAAYRLLHVTTVPACTYDRLDIIASLLGAALAICIACLILKLHATRPTPAKE
jgi:hypothetical protein